MKIVCCQLDIVWENKKANYTKVRRLLETSNLAAGSLVVLPEMFSTGFSMNVELIQEGSDRETEAFLAALARDHGVYVVGGLVNAGPGGRGRNEAVVFNPEGTLLSRYCKIHPFSFGGEAEHYMGGAEIVTFAWQGFVVAPFVCYDLRFPEVFRIAVRRGANLFVVIANWPGKRVQHWTALLQARAIENQAYVVGVNRVGQDPKLAYPGRSLVIDPRGQVIGDAGENEVALTSEIGINEVTTWRGEFPALQDMRPAFLKSE